MAETGDQHTTEADASPGGDAAVEAAARSVQQRVTQRSDDVVTPAGVMFPSNTADAVVSDPGDRPDSGANAAFPSSRDPHAGSDDETEVRRPIPPLLTDVDEAPPTGASEAEPERENTPAGGEPGSGAAKPKPDAGGVRSRAADGAAQAKQASSKARGRFSAAAAGAKGRASSAASDARERASNTDVTEFAHSTTSLIDTARPFFLAGCAAVFAVLGFLEGDAGTAQVFAVGALIFVIGAAFSGEINAYLGARSHARDRAAHKPDGD